MRRSEAALQQSCVMWFRVSYPAKRMLLQANLNGAQIAPVSGPQFRKLSEEARRGIAWKRLEAQGAVKGAADLFLSIPSGELAGLFIEMKTDRGRQSDNQKAFEAAVLAEGYGYAMPRSFDEFVRVVQCYLETGQY